MRATAFFTFPLVFFLSACQYQFGTGITGVSGSFFIDTFTNHTDYLRIGSDLQAHLVDVLRRQKNVVLTKKGEAKTTITGRILEVKKIDREKDDRGIVNETQFVISLELIVQSPKGERKHDVKNIDFKTSSGVYRRDRGGSEDEALREALIDLAESAIVALSDQW